MKLLGDLMDYVKAKPHRGISLRDFYDGKILNPRFDGEHLIFEKERHCILDGRDSTLGSENRADFTFRYAFTSNTCVLEITAVHLDAVHYDWQTALHADFENPEIVDTFSISKHNGQYALTGSLSRDLGTAETIEGLKPLCFTFADNFVDNVFEKISLSTSCLAVLTCCSRPWTDQDSAVRWS